ncbi:extracellular solute-binding protein [Paenibacillus hemerocallicola]|jgi:multiple sugar transport system substrate-binding protein|uniref:Extracellular solute-binding protein n=1 Tax=Paenibacillus hemerocallicola TaxID=1172614 RepID=A0A5C4SYA4_9BACL|nr:extracellular solute-binding protein [Paenibacillus hemerocallicola]TNJ61387.1 extracellular solute-binding protein [Paenibacillus hemerocallicola]
MNGSRKVALAALALQMALAVGCSGGQTAGTSEQPDKSNEPASKANSPDPVKLKLQPVGAGYLYEEDFQMLIAEPLKKKYPHITVEYVVPGKGTMIDDLVAAKTVPDLLLYGIGNYTQYRDLGILTDITPLLKKQKIDLSRFKPWVLENIKVDGKLYSLPYAMNTNAIYYNLDLFDKFGVPYPKSGMSWDDIIEVTKRLSRSDNGVQYKGFMYLNTYWLGYQLSLPFTDPTKKKAAITTDAWSRVFQMMKAIDTLPGNERGSPVADFYDKRILAMVGAYNLVPTLKQEKYQTLRWDVAGYPSFKEKPNTAPPVDLHQITISNSTKHPDEAMLVMDMLTSEEMQLISARRTGRASPLLSKRVEQELGAEMELIKGKNVTAFFETQPAPNVMFANEDIAVQKSIDKFYKDYSSGSIDVNVLMQKIGEDANQAISALQNK